MTAADRTQAGDPSAHDPTADPEPEDAQSYEGGSVGAAPTAEEGAPVAPVAPADGTAADDAAADDPGTGPAEVSAADGQDDADAPGDAEGPEPEPDPLAQAQAERDSYLDQLQRARADYDNLNKRRHKEVAEARDRGQAALVEGLLEVLDNFGFALQASEVSDDTQLAKGVQLVHGQLVAALEQAGLEEVQGVGAPFDPGHHEALMSEADGADRDHPEVAEVLRTGYRFKTQLLRPAAVKVAE